MPAECRVSAVEFLSPPEGGTVKVQVRLEDGKVSVFTAASFEEPRRWTGARPGYRLGPPVLFVRRLDQKSVAAAVEAMARDMGGFWLRYYNSEKKPR